MKTTITIEVDVEVDYLIIEADPDVGVRKHGYINSATVWGVKIPLDKIPEDDYSYLNEMIDESI